MISVRSLAAVLLILSLSGCGSEERGKSPPQILPIDPELVAHAEAEGYAMGGLKELSPPIFRRILEPDLRVDLRGPGSHREHLARNLIQSP